MPLTAYKKLQISQFYSIKLMWYPYHSIKEVFLLTPKSKLELKSSKCFLSVIRARGKLWGRQHVRILIREMCFWNHLFTQNIFVLFSRWTIFRWILNDLQELRGNAIDRFRSNFLDQVDPARKDKQNIELTR